MLGWLVVRNLKLTLAYDGAAFHGWQKQPDLRTVQSTVEQAVRRVIRHQVHVVGASRTDAGVHAAGQVANFWSISSLPAQTLFHAIGARLPKDSTLIHLAEVPLAFHATRSAIAKLYRYRVFADRGRPVEELLHACTYHFWHPLDLSAMARAAETFVGTHDFSAMASRGNARSSNVRHVDRCDVYRVGREVRFDVVGNGFLYNMVRNMVGTLLEVGRGAWPPGRVAEILKSQDRRQAGPTAPARGLCLRWVRYDLAAVPRELPPIPPQPHFKQITEAPAVQEVAKPGRGTRPTESSLAPVMPPGTDLDEEPSG